jgi:hypothetical protein
MCHCYASCRGKDYDCRQQHARPNSCCSPWSGLSPPHPQLLRLRAPGGPPACAVAPAADSARGSNVCHQNIRGRRSHLLSTTLAPAAAATCESITLHKAQQQHLHLSDHTCSVARSRAVAALCLSAAASFSSASRRALSAVARLPSRRPLSAAACCASASCCVNESTYTQAGQGTAGQGAQAHYASGKREA